MNLFNIFATVAVLSCANAAVIIDHYYGCPENFVLIGNKCLFIEEGDKVDWYTAQDRCAEMNSKLLSIESEAEMDKIDKYLTELGFNGTDHSNGFWTAVYDTYNKISATWQQECRQRRCNRWFPIELQHNWRHNELCQQLWYKNHKRYLNDLSCIWPTGWICETMFVKSLWQNIKVWLSALIS